LMRINAEVQQRAKEHIAADAAENIEVKSFHVTLTSNIQHPTSNTQHPITTSIATLDVGC
jgi:hypothetical protein